jgi:toxin ParE1/3/4
VARFRLTVRAEADLLEIADYTLRTWGEAQCDRYLAELEHCCQRLADHPILGRPCDAIRAGLRRREQGKHVVFYLRTGEDIIVLRILHEHMLPELHLDEE